MQLPIFCKSVFLSSSNSKFIADMLLLHNCISQQCRPSPRSNDSASPSASTKTSTTDSSCLQNPPSTTMSTTQSPNNTLLVPPNPPKHSSTLQLPAPPKPSAPGQKFPSSVIPHRLSPSTIHVRPSFPHPP
jgi:hypothetical protein